MPPSPSLSILVRADCTFSWVSTGRRLSLPLTPVLRPDWDLQTLETLGVASCKADEDAWQRIWTESEQLYYGGSTPLFMVEAVK